jgi:hypothetical protein
MSGAVLLRRGILLALLALILFPVARGRRDMQDFTVYHTAGARALATEPLYRASDGHYQFKYLPAFALVVAPLSLVSEETGKLIWFLLTVLAAGIVVGGPIHLLPGRRRSVRVLAALALLITGKFLVRELVHGQTNVLLTAVVVLALVAVRRGSEMAAGALVCVAVVLKPYAILLMPWLAGSGRRRALAAAATALAGALALPALVYGWSGNLTLLRDWMATAIDTTPENLRYPENISFAAMWHRWIGPGALTVGLTVATTLVAAIAAAAVWMRRRTVSAPDYLDVSLLLLLVPLLSPQGWEYVLVLGTPAFVLLVDRWRDLTAAGRTAVFTGFAFTSFAIFDLAGRAVYERIVSWSAPTLGATALAVVLISLRFRADA